MPGQGKQPNNTNKINNKQFVAVNLFFIGQSISYRLQILHSKIPSAAIMTTMYHTDVFGSEHLNNSG